MFIPKIGVPELILILGLVIVIFGPKRLPEVGRSIGRTLREFRKSSKETAEEDLPKELPEAADETGEPVKG
ncbi:MAG: twin-arginine translocase TatA/TatE family subunit [Bacillota bacterium]